MARAPQKVTRTAAVMWPIDSDWQETRLRKMVTKDIGVLYYHLPLSSHCQSPVFGWIGGSQQLDFIGEDL